MQKPFVIAAFAAAALFAALAPAAAKTGGVGWQGAVTVSIPTGSTDQFLHYACPGKLVVTNGAAFAVNQQTVSNGFVITGAGPRLDESPTDYTQWAWNFEWPAGGAPAGSQVVVDVECRKGAP
jgi:hypothetical protein